MPATHHLQKLREIIERHVNMMESIEIENEELRVELDEAYTEIERLHQIIDSLSEELMGYEPFRELIETIQNSSEEDMIMVKPKFILDN